jgi:hypothetical protein
MTIPATGMEHLWSPAGATNGDYAQIAGPPKPQNKPNPLP